MKPCIGKEEIMTERSEGNSFGFSFPDSNLSDYGRRHKTWTHEAAAILKLSSSGSGQHLHGRPPGSSLEGTLFSTIEKKNPQDINAIMEGGLCESTSSSWPHLFLIYPQLQKRVIKEDLRSVLPIGIYGQCGIGEGRPNAWIGIGSKVAESLTAGCVLPVSTTQLEPCSALESPPGKGKFTPNESKHKALPNRPIGGGINMLLGSLIAKAWERVNWSCCELFATIIYEKGFLQLIDQLSALT